jgi:hypothetical protein
MNMYGGARPKPTMTRSQALAKAQSAVAAKFGFNKFPAKGSAEAKEMMDLVRSFKTNPKRIDQGQAQAAFDRFYSPRGRYAKYHPGKSPKRAASQDRLRAVTPKRIVNDARFAKRPDLYDYAGVDVGRFAPRRTGPGGMDAIRAKRVVSEEEALRRARAARSLLTQNRLRPRRGVGLNLLDTAEARMASARY